jgi:hypothetical protein
MILEFGGDAPSRIKWAVWYLQTNFAVYRAFRARADDFRARNPNARFGASMIFEALRYLSSDHAKEDIFAVNNNAISLFARLYLLEEPDAKLETRGAWFDLLSSDERRVILDVFVAQGGVIARRDDSSQGGEQP